MKLYNTPKPKNNAGDILTDSDVVIQAESREARDPVVDECQSAKTNPFAVTDSQSPTSVSKVTRHWVVPSISLQISKVEEKTKPNDSPHRSNRPRKERFIIHTCISKLWQEKQLGMD